MSGPQSVSVTLPSPLCSPPGVGSFVFNFYKSLFAQKPAKASATLNHSDRCLGTAHSQWAHIHEKSHQPLTPHQLQGDCDLGRPGKAAPMSQASSFQMVTWQREVATLLLPAPRRLPQVVSKPRAWQQTAPDGHLRASATEPTLVPQIPDNKHRDHLAGDEGTPFLGTGSLMKMKSYCCRH